MKDVQTQLTADGSQTPLTTPTQIRMIQKAISNLDYKALEECYKDDRINKIHFHASPEILNPEKPDKFKTFVHLATDVFCKPKADFRKLESYNKIVKFLVEICEVNILSIVIRDIIDENSRWRRPSSLASDTTIPPNYSTTPPRPNWTSLRQSSAPQLPSKLRIVPGGNVSAIM